MEPLKSVLIAEYNEMNKGNLEQQGILTSQLREINKKIDGLEESRFVLKEMSQETFDKFYPRYIKERENIAAQLINVSWVLRTRKKLFNMRCRFLLNCLWYGIPVMRV